jgi:hypothetical protein
VSLHEEFTGLGEAQSGYATISGDGGHRLCTLEDPMLLFIIAAIIAIVGVVQLFQGQILFGIILLVAACLVGPGGYSIFHSRRTV